MLSDLLANFNWIDILVLCLITRIITNGSRSTILGEFLALVGAMCATFVTLHYYVRFGDWLNKNIFLPELVQEIFAFILLWLTAYLAFKLIISGWGLIFKASTPMGLTQWIGAIIATLRSFFVCGLVFMLFLLCGSEYLQKIARQSFSGFYLVDFAPRMYHIAYDEFVSKLFPGEPLNEKALDLAKAPGKKKKSGESGEKDGK